MLTLVKNIFRFVRWEMARMWLWIWSDTDTVGVAGSVGKTTTKEVIASVLSQKFKTIKTDENWDPIFNLPITALKTFGTCKFVAELGVDGIGQMSKYLSLVHPRVGVLTRLTLEHTDSEHFGTFQNVIEEESKLLKALPSYGWAVLNGDDEEILKVADKTQAHQMFYGFSQNNDLRIKSFSQKIVDSKAQSTIAIKYDAGERTFTTNLLGKSNAMCTCAGICVGIIMGISFEDIQQVLSKVRPTPGRLEPKHGNFGLVIDDSYNASPAAVESAIDVLVDLDPQDNMLVLGDMLELGSYSKDAHFEIGKYARAKGVKSLAVYGEYSQYIADGYGDRVNTFIADDHLKIVEWVRSKKGTVLVKGSHGTHMEKVVNELIN